MIKIQASNAEICSGPRNGWNRQPPSVPRLELPNEAELGTVAFVVLGLGVGGLDLVDQHHLWAEAQNGQSPVEHSGAQRPGAIYPVPASLV